MSMTQEEQRALATDLGCCADLYPRLFVFDETELAAYTAAVEAKERERCISECEMVGLGRAADLIRSLK